MTKSFIILRRNCRRYPGKGYMVAIKAIPYSISVELALSPRRVTGGVGFLRTEINREGAKGAKFFSKKAFAPLAPLRFNIFENAGGNYVVENHIGVLRGLTLYRPGCQFDGRAAQRV